VPRDEPGAVREYRYAVDRDGRVFHDGTEIVDPAVLRLFLRVMQRTPDGRYLAMCQGERNWFESADTPLVIQRLRLVGPAGAPERIDLVFGGDHVEALDPATLTSDAAGVFCRVRGGALPARFGRVALQQLAPLIGDGGGGAALRMAGVTHPIRVVPRLTEERLGFPEA
jgi:hypothetical protein